MSLSASRTALRRHAANARIQLGRRHASQASEAASSAKQGASELAGTARDKLGPAATKASEGLSRVASSAGNVLGRAGTALGNVGGPIGRLVGAVQGLIPPTVYYSRVALELGKIVFEARKMSPPSAASFQSYWTGILQTLRNPSALSSHSQSTLSSIRNFDRQQLASAGIIAAEVLGFFTVGEMIGRFKLVGYRSSAPAHHD